MIEFTAQHDRPSIERNLCNWVSQMTAPKTRDEVFAQYPVLAGDSWSWIQARNASVILNRLPKAIKATALAIISELGVPSYTALKILDTLDKLGRSDRNEIVRLYSSGDPAEMSLAKSRAAKLPPMPPNRLPWLREAIRLVEKCIDDKISVGEDDLGVALCALSGVLETSEEQHACVRRAWLDITQQAGPS